MLGCKWLVILAFVIGSGGCALHPDEFTGEFVPWSAIITTISVTLVARIRIVRNIGAIVAGALA